jgi:tetratricopeptide (TPR) repeat protein
VKRPLILAAVLYVTFIGGTAYTANNVILRMVFHLTASAAVGWWLVHLIRKKRPLPRTPFDIPLAIYVLLLALAVVASQNVRLSAEQSWVFLMHVLWFYVFVDAMRQGHQRWVMEALFMAAGVFLIVSFVEVVSWYFGTGFAGFNQGWYEIGGLSDPLPPGGYKLSLALNLSTLVGNYALLLMPIAWGWSLTVKRADNRWGVRLIALGLLLVLWGSGSRGAQAGLAAALVILTGFWLIRSGRGLFHARVMVPGMAAGLVIVSAGAMILATRADSLTDRGRVDMWENAIDMTSNDPLTGQGVYQFGAAYRELRDPDLVQDKIVAAHNLLLNTSAEIGVGGFILLMWLGAAFLILWRARWMSAHVTRQIRLEGILAALAGFSVHSMVDTFTLSASVLPILIVSAYVVAGEYTPFHKPEKQPFSGAYRWLRYAALALVLGYLVWLLRVDVAELRFFNGLRYQVEEEYADAETQFERAQSLDPNMSIYVLQEAYLLGLRAEGNPQNYLQAAIDAHESTLQENPTFDVGFANLAALYAQQGDYDRAADYMATAQAIYPRRWEYRVKLAEYLEAAGSIDEAAMWYAAALQREWEIARSSYWDEHPARAMGIEMAYESLNPGIATMIAIHRNDATRAEALVSQTDDDLLGNWGQARYASFIGDAEAALAAYDRALAGRVLLEWRVEMLAERAELHLSLGDFDAAERDARTAIFLDAPHGARGYWVLAQLDMMKDAPDEDQINEWLARAVQPNVVVQEYASAMYARVALLGLLPQLRLPEASNYEPWLLLAERYAADDDPDTDPQDVFDVLGSNAPYLMNPEN